MEFLVVSGVVLAFTAFTIGVPLALVYGPTWLEKRRLVQLARDYGIEYVPGEDLGRLRDRIIQRRDKLL